MVRLFLVSWLFVVIVAVSSTAEAQRKHFRTNVEEGSTPMMVLQFSEPEALVAGRKNLQVGRPALAAGHFRQVIEEANRPRYRAAAYNGLCAAFIELKRYRKALEACNKSLEINASNWHALSNKGTVYFHMGRLRYAINTYQEGQKLAPKSKTLKTNLALAKNKLESLTGGSAGQQDQQLDNLWFRGL